MARSALPGSHGTKRRGRWSSFVADPLAEPPRILREAGNPAHRLRVEHDDQTLLIHLSDEDGGGWTVFAVHRESRRWAVAQAPRQIEAAKRAYTELHRIA
ncbi:MAG TPA: hypothetical protein VFH02_10825 [Jiangellaceae bacterium]|nr:hypothetical protein [Jiangellaceae bacterium]